jgi:hypothetical protein
MDAPHERVSLSGILLLLWPPASLRRYQPVPEERQDLIAGCDRRLTGLVDQMRGYDAVRCRDVLCEKWRDICVPRAIRKNPAYEAITKGLSVAGEASSRTELVALEAIAHNGEIFPYEPFAHSFDLVGRDFDAGRIVQRQ